MQNFDKILERCLEVGRAYADVVFIGGVAVYLHALRGSTSVVPETSHDADFMISISDYGILKDLEEVTATPRLDKHQMLSGDVEFDVYVERWNSLLVPYDEVARWSVVSDPWGMRIACLEHLLVLKLEALGKRSRSRKGEKDRRDVVQVGLMLGRRARRSLLDPYLRGDHLATLVKVAESSVFYEVCRKNAHAAKKMRGAFEAFVEHLAG